VRGYVFGASLRFACATPCCLACSPVGADQNKSSHQELLLPGFQRFGRPPRRRISLQCQLGNLHWRDSHPLDHRLASLHNPTYRRTALLALRDCLAGELRTAHNGVGLECSRMITALAISNYRSLRDLVISLQKLNVITGANGSGKSNLYRAVRLLADIAQGRVVPSLGTC